MQQDARGWRRFRTGLILLGCAVAIPLALALWFYATTGDPHPLETALPLDQSASSFDIKVSQRGWYLLSVQGRATAHDDYDGLTYDHGLDCMLGLPQSDLWPEKCAGQPAPLRFHFRLTGPHGVVQEGEYHQPERYWSVFVDQQSRFAGAEFASLNDLPRGRHRLELTGLVAPAGLAARKPELRLRLEPNPYDLTPMLVSAMLLALAAGLALAGVVLLVLAALAARRDGRGDAAQLASAER